MASTLPPPSGSLLEYLEQMRLAINRAINLIGDDSILVTETTHGKELSFVGETGGGTGEAFFGKILAWEHYGTSGKRWKYSWVEVEIGQEVVQDSDPDEDQDIVVGRDPRSGTYVDGETTYLINLAEINNTIGDDDIQGNGTELVAPLGGQHLTKPTVVVHDRIVPIWTASRRDGSVLYWTDVPNSNNIRTNTTVQIGVSVPVSGNDDGVDDYPQDGGVDTTNYNSDAGTGQSGHADEGKKVVLISGLRSNYNHNDDIPKLREFHRQVIFKPNGEMSVITGEAALVVDDPESCS